MDPFNSTYNYKARLDRISIDKSSEPIKNEATLLLRKQKALPADASAGPPSTAQHWMEVHVDGRRMAHWHLDQLVRQSSVAAPGLLARSFYSFRLEKIIQVVLPLPMPVEQSLLPSSSQLQNPFHLKIIRLHLHTHQEFHTAISFLTRDAGFHHQEAVGLRSISAMNLSDARDHGSRGAMRPPIRPMCPSPLLAPVSKTIRETPVRSGATTAALDYDTRESFGTQSQGHISSWNPLTWDREGLSSSSQPQTRPETAQSYQRYQARAFLGDQRPPRENGQGGQWLSEEQLSLTTLGPQAFHENACVDVPSQDSSDNREVGLSYNVSEPPPRAQALALGRANSLSSVNPLDLQRQSSMNINPVQKEHGPLGEAGGMIPRSSASIEHLARPQSRVTFGSNGLPARTSSRNPFPRPLVPRAVASPRGPVQRIGPRLHGVKERVPSFGRSDMDSTNIVALARGRWSPAAVTAGSGQNMPMPKRPSSNQGIRDDPGMERRKMRKTMYEPRTAQHTIQPTNQAQLDSPTLMKTRVSGPESNETWNVDPALSLARATCMRCRRMHSRCDRSRPSCGSCTKDGRACTYPKRVQDYTSDLTKSQDPQAVEHSMKDGSSQTGVAVMEAEDEHGTVRQTIVEDAPDPRPVQETGREGMGTADAGTSPTSIITSDATTQTDRPEQLQMDISRWTSLVRSAMELQKDEVAKAARSIEGVHRTGPQIRETLLKVARMGLNLAQEVRGLYRVSVAYGVTADDGRWRGGLPKEGPEVCGE